MAQKMWFRLGEEDAAKYPEGAAWFLVDRDLLYNMRAGDLAALEAAMNGLTIARMETGFRERSAIALKAQMFIARRQAGVNEKWENFDPFIWKADWRRTDPALGDEPEEQDEDEGDNNDEESDDFDPPTTETAASPSS